MKIPDKLKIGGHTYKIELHTEGEICKDKADCGIINRTNGTIGINANLIQSEQEVTLIHEIFHALNSTIDHDLLSSLAEQFYQVLKDNNLI